MIINVEHENIQFDTNFMPFASFLSLFKQARASKEIPKKLSKVSRCNFNTSSYVKDCKKTERTGFEIVYQEMIQ